MLTFETNTLISAKPTSKADRRTKTRLGMHGQQGWLFGRVEESSRLFGPSPVRAVLLTSVTGKWFGWFPTEHLILEEQTEP